MSHRKNAKHKAVDSKAKTPAPFLPPTITPNETDGKAQAIQPSVPQHISVQVEMPRSFRAQNWLPIIISGLTLCVVIVHAFLYNKQWQAMNEQLNVMKSGLEQERATHLDDNRAYLSLKSIEFDKPLNTFEETGGQLIHLAIHFENTGRTPALNVAKYAAIRIQPIGSERGMDYYIKDYKENAEDFKKDGWVDSRAIVPPGMDYVDDEPVAFSPEEINTLKSSKYAYYFQALIEYDDIFGRHWTSEICLLSKSYYRDDFEFCGEHNTFK